MAEFDRDIMNQIEREERWLATLPTPEPSAAAVSRTKAAVRREVLSGKAVAWRSWSPMIGVFSAAALIVLAVYVAWSASRTASPSVSGALTMIAQSPVASDLPQIITTQEQTVLATFDTRQKDLEDWSKDTNWDLAGNSLSAAINEIWAEPTKANSENGKRSS